MFQLARDAKCSQVSIEPNNLFVTELNKKTGNPSQCRPDLLIKDVPYDTGLKSKHLHKDIILDVSITYPASFSAIQSKKTDLIQGAASNHTFDMKKRKYEKISDGKYKVIPIILETFGFIHETSKAFIKHLIHLAAQYSPIHKSVLHNYWFKRISVALQRYNAQMVLDYATKSHEHAQRNLATGFDDTLQRCINNPTM